MPNTMFPRFSSERRGTIKHSYLEAQVTYHRNAAGTVVLVQAYPCRTHCVLGLMLRLSENKSFYLTV